MTDPSIAPAPTLFDRIVFAALVPALLLPVIVATVAIYVSSIAPSDGTFDDGISGLITAVYCFVLLGSMTLNSWLLLRHPQSFATRALPRRIGVELIVLWGLQLAWILTTALGIFGAPSVAFGVLLAVLSIVVCAAAVVRNARDRSAKPLGALELPGWALRIAIAYLVVAVIALAAQFASPAFDGGFSEAGGALGGPATWALIVLGLPWSHPLYLVGVLAAFGGSSWTLFPSAVVTLSVLANVVLVSLILASPVRRVAIVNWFFRLSTRKAAVDPVVESPPLP